MISVIVSVYNVDMLLQRCLESISAQTYHDIEVILVDDGSTDSSGKICDGFCLSDRRFRVIHTENHGVSAARNRGLEESSGEWIYIADADDYLHPRALELLFAGVSAGYDVAESGYRMSYPPEREPFDFPETGTELPPFREIPYESCLCGVFSSDFTFNLIQTVLWNKLYSRRILEGLSFERHIMEDVFLNYEVFRRRPKVVFMDVALYSYHQRPESYSHKTTPATFVEILKQTVSLMDRVPSEDVETRRAALIKTYRKLLTVRYITNRTEAAAAAGEISEEVLSRTKKEYFRSRSIPFKEKVMFRTLWAFPFIHSVAMKRLGN